MARSGTHARTSWPGAVFVACVAAGLVFVAASSTADGSDLRPAGGDVGGAQDEAVGEAAGIDAEFEGVDADVVGDGAGDCDGQHLRSGAV